MALQHVVDAQFPNHVPTGRSSGLIGLFLGYTLFSMSLHLKSNLLLSFSHSRPRLGEFVFSLHGGVVISTFMLIILCVELAIGQHQGLD